MDVSLLTDLTEQTGPAFSHLVKTTLIATAAVLLLHLVVSLIARSRSSKRQTLARWNLWEKLVYAVTILSVAMLGGTAFYSVIVHGVMHGWSLLAHMMWAGVFVVVLPLITFTWAAPSRFCLGRNAAPGTESARRFSWLTKLTFWLMLATGVITAGSMLLGMLPLADTERLYQLLDVHRYSGLVLVVAAIVHFYNVWLNRFGLA